MTTRWGYRIDEIAERTGLPRSTVARHAARAGVQQKKIGALVLLEAGGCERAFGFGSDSEGTVQPTAEDLAVVRELLA